MFELRCLGEATLRSPTGQLIGFRSRKHFALLTYLALNADRAHRRERLASLLWSDGKDAKARHSLSQALYAVRRLLDGTVRIQGEDLELKPEGLNVDAIELERRLRSGDAGAAADLYKGDFLEGFVVRGASGFEEWAGQERARVAALARDALRRTIKAGRDRCDWLDVRNRAGRLVVLDPFDETAYTELMRALWMLGDRAEALDRYDDLKRMLAVELQASPSRETEALAERIRQRPVRGGWSTHRLLRESACEILHDPPFVGRKSELAALAEEWDQTLTGESRAVALVGPAGIGKTRLADEFINSLALSDITVLRGQCYEAEQTLPYGPIAEALRQGIGALDLSDVPPHWLAELARIVPEVSERVGELPEPAALDAEGSRRRLYEGLAQVLRSACDARPLLLFVDDLHWADDSSIALLHYLHRRVTNGLYLLTAFRPEEIAAREGSSASDLLADRKSQFRAIQLDGLDPSASSDLLVTLLGEGAESSALAELRELCGGNPFFAIELARNLAEEEEKQPSSAPPIPESIRALLERRFSGLAERSAAVMQQAACIGSRFSYETLTAAVDLAPVELDAVVRELVRSRIVTLEGDFVHFRHDLIREVAWSRVPSALHSALHLRAARALMKVGGAEGDVAKHLSSGGDVRRAHAFAVRGADQAERVFALEEAAELLELAIEHAPSEHKRINVVGRLGKVRLHMRHYKKARPLLEERLDYVQRNMRANLIEIEARRDLLFVNVYSSTLTVQESGSALKALYKDFLARKLDAPRLEAEILGALFWAAARSLDRILAEDTISRIQKLHDRCGSPSVRCRTARSLGIYERYKGRLENAESLLQDGLRWAREAVDEPGIVACYVGLTTLLSRTLRHDLAQSILDVGLPQAERHADPALTSNILCNCANCFVHLGQFEQAELLLNRARAILSTAGDVPDLSPSISYNLGTMAFMKGDLTGAEAHWRRALHLADEAGLLPVRAECLAALGRVMLRRGELQSAHVLAIEALRLNRRGGFLIDERYDLTALLGRLRQARGEYARAVRRLRRQADAAKDSDMPLYLAAQLVHLEILVEENLTGEAEKLREELCEVALRIGATWWADKAEMLC